MTKPRPSLASLVAQKAPTAPIASGLEAVHSPGGPSKESRVSVIVRMSPAERKALRRIALEQDTTVQALVEQAVADIVARNAPG